MPDALRLALGTFTAVRVPPPRRVDGSTAGRAMLLAPLTALPSALAWVALGLAAARGWLPPFVAGTLAVAVTTLLSRAMHLDGLADTADGLTVAHDRDRSLEVMRRGDIGPAGVSAIVVTLLVQVGSLASLGASDAGVLLAVTALLASRLAPGVACRRGVPAARSTGLGRAVAGTVAPGGLAGLALVLLAGSIGITGMVGFPWYAAGLVVVTAILGAWLVTRRAVQRLGGITGDTIGAAIELSLTAALVVAGSADLLLR